VVVAWRTNRRAVLVAAAVGLVLAVVPVTVPDVAAGRYSGWWDPLSRVPSIGGHTNPLILLGAIAGAVLLAGALLAAPARARAVLLVAIVAFVTAQASNFYAWQRYHEPFVLGTLALFSALASQRVAPMRPAARALGAGLLCALLAVVSWRSLNVAPVSPGEKPMPQHLTPAERAAMGIELPGADHPPPNPAK
jgi:hypothetical protein